MGITYDDISFVVELDMSDDDIKRRASGIRLDPETGEVVSVWEREQRKIKKPKRYNEDGETEESEEEIDEETGEPVEKPKIFDETQILMRECDQPASIVKEI